MMSFENFEFDFVKEETPKVEKEETEKIDEEEKERHNRNTYACYVCDIPFNSGDWMKDIQCSFKSKKEFYIRVHLTCYNQFIK